MIATSTVVDITGVDNEVLDRAGKDEYWMRDRKEGKGEDDFFKDGETAQVRRGIGKFAL